MLYIRSIPMIYYIKYIKKREMDLVKWMSFPFEASGCNRFHLKTQIWPSFRFLSLVPQLFLGSCRFKTGLRRSNQPDISWYPLIFNVWRDLDPGDAGPGKNTRVNNIPPKKMEPPRDHCLLKHGLNLHALSIIMKPKAPNMLLPQDDF